VNENWEPRLSRRLVADGRLSSFVLADVGASGGIPSRWHAFGDALRATGFDPLIHEVARLNNAEANPKIRYVPAMVGYRNYKQLFPDSDWNTKPNDNFWSRTSAARAQQVTGRIFSATYDPTGNFEQVTELTELDEYFCDASVDFLKTDTDGFDIAVLLGARQLLSRSPVLAVQAEVMFQGVLNEVANTFSNVDRLLRSSGFTLFDMAAARYSRGILPKQFRHRQCADTVAGQIFWADVLYVRDAAAPQYESTWGVSLSVEHILRLACIHELYELDDCAAELLVTFRERIPFDVEPYLDLITPELGGKRVSYREYYEAFERDVTSFY